jgi:hypothetical protein
MKPVELSEIKTIAEYEIERETLRPRMMQLKDRRRIRVGEHLTFLFENRDTVRYQVQEMMRIERIAKPAEIQHELDTYNELVPAKGELCASLLIEYETPAERDVHLKALLGLDKHIWIEAGGERSLAVFDNRQIGDTRISSVQYLRVKLTKTQIDAWAQGAKIVVDHPYYSMAHAFTPAELQELSQDFV